MFLFSRTRGGTRTLTAKGHSILSAACLPFHHPSMSNPIIISYHVFIKYPRQDLNLQNLRFELSTYTVPSRRRFGENTSYSVLQWGSNPRSLILSQIDYHYRCNYTIRFTQYPERDSNPHILRHYPLKVACLPFHHLGEF